MFRTKSIPKTFKTKDLPEERVCLCEMSTAAAGVKLTVAEHGAAAALPVPGNAKEEAPPKDFPVPAAGPEAAGKSKGPPPLPYFQLFRYATAWDHFILAVGVLMSVSAKWWLSPEAVVFVVFFVFYCFVLFCFVLVFFVAGHTSAGCGCGACVSDCCGFWGLLECVLRTGCCCRGNG